MDDDSNNAKVIFPVDVDGMVQSNLELNSNDEMEDKNVVQLTYLLKYSLSNLRIRLPEQGMQKDTKN